MKNDFHYFIIIKKIYCLLKTSINIIIFYTHNDDFEKN